MAHLVLFDYNATNAKELTVKKGDTVWIVEAPPKKQWWKVHNERKQEGFVPANYLKPKDKKSTPAATEQSSSRPSQPTVDYAEGIPPSSRKVRALYPYAAQRLDELSVKENDEILVLEEENDGWFRGFVVSTNASGWLPLCFTTEITASSSSPAGKGNEVRQPPQRSGDSLAFNTALMTQGGATNVISCCTVVYDFAATQEGQLTLRKGDVLWILEKTNENWWQARSFHGQVGYVPVLYVKEEDEAPVNTVTSAASTLVITQPVSVGTLTPASTTTVIQDVKKAPWYHETFSREKSESSLKDTAIGTYLIRASTSHIGDYSLSVNIGSATEHFKISFDVATKQYVFGIRRFDNLFALVDFYRHTNAVFTLANGTQIFLVAPYKTK